MTLERTASNSAGSRMSLVVRSLLVLGGVALAAVGCGAVMPGAVDSGTSSVSVADGPGPGVTGDSVKVAFIGTDLSAVSEVTGFANADPGDVKNQVKALETWVNANGGVAGKKLDAVYVDYNAMEDSPAAEEQLCDKITQDIKAFAVVLTGQLQSNARPCYAQRQTLMLDETLVGNDQKLFDELSPYLWSPSFPSYDDFVRAYIGGLADQGFFKGQDKVGVVAADGSVNRGIYKSLALPQLKDLDLEPVVSWIDTTDLGTLNTGLTQAATNFQGKGVERVIFLGGARMAPFFLTSASAVGFEAKYGISTFDNPAFFVNNPSMYPTGSLSGMVGLGFSPGYDVPDSQYAFPSTDAEKECIKIYADGGEKFKARENARAALAYCDAARVLNAVGKKVTGDLNGATWSDAAANVGNFQPAAGFSGKLSDGRYAVPDSYRAMTFQDGCGCFTYEGGNVEYPTR